MNRMDDGAISQGKQLGRWPILRWYDGGGNTQFFLDLLFDLILSHRNKGDNDDEKLNGLTLD